MKLTFIVMCFLVICESISVKTSVDSISIQQEARPSIKPDAQLSKQPEAQISIPPESQTFLRPEVQTSQQPEAQNSLQRKAHLSVQPEAQPSVQQSEVQSSTQSEVQSSTQSGMQSSTQSDLQSSLKPEARTSIQPDAQITFQSGSEDDYAECPKGYQLRGNFCYKYIDKWVPFEDAVSYCKATGKLAEPRTQEEQDALVDVSQDQDVWIGVVRDVHRQFRWLEDKLEIDFHVWYPGEPVPDWGVDCGVNFQDWTRNGNYFWAGSECSIDLPFVCQGEPVKRIPDATERRAKHEVYFVQEPKEVYVKSQHNTANIFCVTAGASHLTFRCNGQRIVKEHVKLDFGQDDNGRTLIQGKLTITDSMAREYLAQYDSTIFKCVCEAWYQRPGQSQWQNKTSDSNLGFVHLITSPTFFTDTPIRDYAITKSTEDVTPESEYQDTLSLEYDVTTTSVYDDTQTSDYEITPTSNYKDTPPSEKENATTPHFKRTQTSESKDISNSNNGNTLTSDYESTPTSDSKDISTSENGNTPISDYESTPTSDSKDISTSENEISPTSESKNTTTSVNENISTSDYESTPTSDSKSTPTSASKNTPTSETDSTPTSNYKSTPTSENEDTPTSDYVINPTSEIESTQTSDYESTPHSNSQDNQTSENKSTRTSKYDDTPTLEYGDTQSSKYESTQTLDNEDPPASDYGSPLNIIFKDTSNTGIPSTEYQASASPTTHSYDYNQECWKQFGKCEKLLRNVLAPSPVETGIDPLCPFFSSIISCFDIVDLDGCPDYIGKSIKYIRAQLHLTSSIC